MNRAARSISAVMWLPRCSQKWPPTRLRSMNVAPDSSVTNIIIPADTSEEAM